MANYNFDEIQGDQPIILMNGIEYKLRYPTVADIENIQTLKDDDAKSDAIYAFVENTTENQVPFKEALKDKDIRVLRAFTDMIKKEFGVE